MTGEADLKLLKLGGTYESWQAARRNQAGELIGRMQLMCDDSHVCNAKM
jgi:hypothetical protein